MSILYPCIWFELYMPPGSEIAGYCYAELMMKSIYMWGIVKCSQPPHPPRPPGSWKKAQDNIDTTYFWTAEYDMYKRIRKRRSFRKGKWTYFAAKTPRGLKKKKGCRHITIFLYQIQWAHILFIFATYLTFLSFSISYWQILYATNQLNQ